MSGDEKWAEVRAEMKIMLWGIWEGDGGQGRGGELLVDCGNGFVEGKWGAERGVGGAVCVGMVEVPMGKVCWIQIGGEGRGEEVGNAVPGGVGVGVGGQGRGGVGWGYPEGLHVVPFGDLRGEGNVSV